MRAVKTAPVLLGALAADIRAPAEALDRSDIDLPP